MSVVLDCSVFAASNFYEFGFWADNHVVSGIETVHFARKMACFYNRAEKEAGNISKIKMTGSERLGTRRYTILKSSKYLPVTLGFDNDGFRQWNAMLDAAQVHPLSVPSWCTLSVSSFSPHAKLSSVGEARYALMASSLA